MSDNAPESGRTDEWAMSDAHPRLPGGVYVVERRGGYQLWVTDGFGRWKDVTDERIDHDLVRYYDATNLVHTTPENADKAPACCRATERGD